MIYAGGNQCHIPVYAAVSVEIAAEGVAVFILFVVGKNSEDIFSLAQSIGEFKTETAITTAMCADVLSVEPHFANFANR